MSKKVISQRVARRLRKRVKELADERTALHSRWLQSSCPGRFLMRMNTDVVSENILRTARRLSHAVVARLSANDKDIEFYAVSP